MSPTAKVRLSASSVLPPLISPRVSFEGRVTDFREVTGLDVSSHFEFKLNSKAHLGGILRAHYFDRGFYYGDSAVSNGDVVRVSYFAWTNDILEMSELWGRHAGWAYREGETGAGPWLLGALGVLVFGSGVAGWMTDRAAQPDVAEV